MEKIAETSYPVLELIAHRWSPRAYADKPVEREKLLSILEAARWAASCYNAQPWRYLIATKEDREQYERLLSCLVEFNQQWAKAAPVLMVSFARREFDFNGKPNNWAQHDVGQASANMALQAAALGLQIHQMAGFDPVKVRETFQIPPEFDPVAAIAVGYAGEPDSLPDPYREREKEPRSRHHLEKFAFLGAWDRPIVAGESSD